MKLKVLPAPTTAEVGVASLSLIVSDTVATPGAQQQHSRSSAANEATKERLME
jgi:hypothetical protein